MIQLTQLDDWVRLLNTTLGFITMWMMTVATWRMSPKLSWYEITGRQGIVVVLFSAMYRNQFWMPQHAGYGLGVFLYTLGFTVSIISFNSWIRDLPHRVWADIGWVRWVRRVINRLKTTRKA